MTTRLTTRDVVRSEMQELFHEGFNLMKALETNLRILSESSPGAAGAPAVQEMERLTNRLIAIQELLRARMLSTIG